MERHIKEEILAPLDFTYLHHYIDFIKGKYVKHIKKSGAIRSSGVLEIIHTNICGPFNIRSVDGFNSFITVTPHVSNSYDYVNHVFKRP
jgi:hypothetical protein